MIEPVSQRESERLKALDSLELLDTAPEEEFDRITELAARILEVPFALISLVGAGRQFFKSHYGTDICETLREHSFCTYAIREAAPLVVPDATLDPRFANNPLVTGQRGLRFYAGAPMTTAGGHNIGSLCVLDTRPRGFDGEKIRTLASLATVAMAAVEARLTCARLEREIAAHQEAATRQRHAENRLWMLESSVENANDAVLITEAEPIDAPGPRIIYANKAFARMTGYSVASLIGKNPRIFQGPKTDPATKAAIRHSLKRWKPVRVELINYRADGSEFWVELNIVPVANAQGWYTHWVSIQRDITERKRALKEIEDSHHLLRSIIDGTDNVIFIKDRDSRYLLINPAGAALFGRMPEEIVGKDDFDLFPPEEARETQAFDREIMRLDRPLERESTDRIGGVERVFLSTKSPYRDTAGNLLGVIGIVREITEQRRAADALRAAKEEAERANRSKSEFLSRMSHELRTPLNAIIGFGQLLEMDGPTPRQLQSIEHVLRGGRHLLDLINEVLDIARIEAGNMELSPEPVPVEGLLRQTISLLRPLAVQRGIAMDISPADPAIKEAAVLADGQRLRQVLLNLVSNAIKYNRPSGRVMLAWSQADDPARLRLLVRDTGQGISPANLRKLFSPFERLDAGDEGTGIGLVISRRLAEAMGGTLTVESVVGWGSTFAVELPLASGEQVPVVEPPPEETPPLPPGEGGTSRTILYVEDNSSNLDLIRTVLSGHKNVTLLTATRGMAGLALARERLPDLILLDLHLPDLDGDSLLAMLKDDPLTRGIPVVIVSADAMPRQIERLRGLGARAYLTKPYKIPELLRTVDGVLAMP